MKIAVISTLAGAKWGGCEELWSVTAEAALDASHQVLVSVRGWPELSPKLVALREQGARLDIRGRSRGTRFRRRICRSLRRCRLGAIVDRLGPFRTVHAFEPDALCISLSSSYEMLPEVDLIESIQSYRVPYILVIQYVSEWTLLDSSNRERATKFFLGANRVLFVAEENLRTVERQLATELPNATVVRNPLNIVGLEPEPWPQHRKLALANVGRLYARDKGQDLLFAALSESGWRDRNVVVNLYGQGADREYLEKLARFYGIERLVRFRGHVSNLREVWRHNHMLVMPSRAEGTPLALVEAMVSGRAAIVTDVGGNREWISEGRNGFVADAASVASFGDALERAWAERLRWEELGENAHNSALEKVDRTPGRTVLSLMEDVAGMASKKCATSRIRRLASSCAAELN